MFNTFFINNSNKFSVCMHERSIEMKPRSNRKQTTWDGVVVVERSPLSG